MTLLYTIAGRVKPTDNKHLPKIARKLHHLIYRVLPVLKAIGGRGRRPTGSGEVMTWHTQDHLLLGWGKENAKRAGTCSKFNDLLLGLEYCD